MHRSGRTSSPTTATANADRVSDSSSDPFARSFSSRSSRLHRVGPYDEETELGSMTKRIHWTAGAAAGAMLLLGILLARAYPLLDPDEGRNAEVAREMAASGHVVVPTLLGMPYLDK